MISTRRLVLLATTWVLLFISIFVYFQTRTDAVETTAPTETVQTPEPTPEPPREGLNADKIFKLVNEYRTEQGVAPLKRSKALDNSAMEKCLDMQEYQYWSHDNPVTGETPFAVIERHYDYYYAGENLARKGWENEAEPVTGWKDSPKHNAVMLDGEFTVSGIAACPYNPEWTRPTDGFYIVQHFATP